MGVAGNEEPEIVDFEFDLRDGEMKEVWSRFAHVKLIITCCIPSTERE
jgi:hypothetical protein